MWTYEYIKHERKTWMIMDIYANKHMNHGNIERKELTDREFNCMNYEKGLHEFTLWEGITLEITENESP